MLDLNGGSQPGLTEDDGGSGGKEKQQRLVA
jgi:hypothetical protein